MAIFFVTTILPSQWAPVAKWSTYHQDVDLWAVESILMIMMTTTIIFVGFCGHVNDQCIGQLPIRNLNNLLSRPILFDWTPCMASLSSPNVQMVDKRMTTMAPSGLVWKINTTHQDTTHYYALSFCLLVCVNIILFNFELDTKILTLSTSMIGFLKTMVESVIIRLRPVMPMPALFCVN